MKLISIIFLLTLNIIGIMSDLNNGFADMITIGPNYYVVGININTNNYPAGTAFNVPSNASPNKTYDVIQKALTEIGKHGGGVVHILAGEYVLIRNIMFGGNHTHLTGDGMDVTILKLADYAPSFIVGTSKRSGFLRARDTSHLIVSNMTLDGNKNYQYYDETSAYGRYGLFTEGCKHVWFDNVKIVNFQGYGFDPHGWKTKGVYGEYLTITNCVAENNNWDGFTLDQTYHMYVSNCVARNNGRHGFNIVTGTKYANITGNAAYTNGFYDPHGGSGCGFMVQNNQNFGTSDVSITGNYADYSKKAGICLNNVYNINVMYNRVETTCICFSIDKGSYTTITQNLCNTNKLSSVKNVNVTTTYGTGSGIYMYDNTFNKIATCPK